MDLLISYRDTKSGSRPATDENGKPRHARRSTDYTHPERWQAQYLLFFGRQISMPSTSVCNIWSLHLNLAKSSCSNRNLILINVAFHGLLPSWILFSDTVGVQLDAKAPNHQKDWRKEVTGSSNMKGNIFAEGFCNEAVFFISKESLVVSGNINLPNSPRTAV